MFGKIDNLLKLFGGRCIIIEDGEPRYVVLSLEEYLALREGTANPGTSGAEDRQRGEDLQAFERINHEMDMFKKEDAGETVPVEPMPAPNKAEYRIEDIPF